MNKVHIKFLTHYPGYKPGDVIEIRDNMARILVHQGRAMYLDNKKHKYKNESSSLR